MSLQQLYQESTRLLQTGQADAAISMLRKQLETTPNDELTLSILGSALMRKGDFPAAFEVFKQATKHHPNSYAAHGDLAFAHIKAGNSAQAVESFERSTEINPGFYQAWCYLVKLYFDLGQFDASKDAFAKASDTDPFSEEYKKIQSAMGSSRFADAEQIARNILAKLPGHPKAAYALAHLATTVGAHEESAKILRHGLEHFPIDTILRTALVSSLEETGNYAEGVTEAETVAELDPDKAANWQMVGRLHSHCGNYEKSLAAYDKALSRCSLTDLERGNLELLRGHMLKIMGNSEQAVKAYNTSITSTPDNGAGWWALADMKTHKFSKEDRDIMRQLAENTSVLPAQRTQAAFALGKAFEDDGLYEDAFHWYRLANELRPDISFSSDRFRDICGEIRDVFTPELLARQAAPAAKGPTPIFIVGLPRAGSTLIEQILSSHSQIEGTMELVNLPNLVRRINIEGGRRHVAYPMSLAGFTPAELAAFGQSYLDETALYRTDKPYFIDKLPTNFERVGLLHMILPDAIIIDARRHPLDGGFSCFKQHFAGGHEFSYNLENIGHYYNSYLTVMDHWNKVLPGKVHCVQYENMIEDTEHQISRLLDHCGVDVEDQCFEFYKNKRAVRTASSQQVRQPIYRKSKGVWQHFEAHLQPLKDALGADTLERFKDYAGL
ncbi:tetratricopeptide repeat-containing sulfotransferase family protein [Emcibacter sp.]|uniref:tetratricopeptide repeat-containing sulfotransferase family protein n=1 Tax=Emcibacter sp. TaxID=1979954 RepID=UPI002AA6D0AC|nr:sulfotransferase [Emcibacter sp.]